ncbi:glutamate--tRNA ligase [Haloglycomyces albus]|uniref:glutamate--tRNA ligase n=1 Tax=Haloglycomyces albus TaxID=526067 RepID=UPI00046D02EA|nr:glutamate--tRNA ligase [Haloglycomyces albus]
MSNIRTRFCPSPTGTPHVGLVRTCLFSWGYARHFDGSFIFRIEDTDAARDSEESYNQLLDALSWLGLSWDEGPDIGGPYGPYRQSERGDSYSDVIDKLVENGYAYAAFSTNDEVKARHEAAGRDPQLGYDNYDRDLTEEQKAAFRAEGRRPVYRMRMPDEDITFTDFVRGEVTYPAGTIPDYVIARGDGSPLYTLTNPLDDAMQKVNVVVRGEDLLPSTPRQIVLWRALTDLGIADGVPEYAHLPLITDERGKKMSKRDPRSNLLLYKDEGYLPEGVLNYVATLGWAIGPDRDVFTVSEFLKSFDLHDVKSNPARFDEKKFRAICSDHFRAADTEQLVEQTVPFLRNRGLLPDEPTDAQMYIVRSAMPMVQERCANLGEAAEMMRFFFAGQDFEMEAGSVKKGFKEGSDAVLDASINALEGLDDWRTDGIESVLKTALVERMELKPRKAFTPLRVAVSGKTVSPPLFESMELLGRDVSLQRLRDARATL